MDAFASLAVVQVLPHTRLLPSACCPDKDLVVLVSRLGGKDRMSLWKMQGSKKWEVDVGTEGTDVEEIVSIAWSPDGQYIAVAHHPPRLTLHSVQDGLQQRYLSVTLFSGRPLRITNTWWFQDTKISTAGSIPDIFKRDGLITLQTGTALSILKTLPLLDALPDDNQKLSVTDLFAFQGSQTRAATKSTQPEIIQKWPVLSQDLFAASINSPTHEGNRDSFAAHEGPDKLNPNLNSILAVADDQGHLHCFLDGSYPLGAVRIHSANSITSMFKDPKRHVYMVHPQEINRNPMLTSLAPTFVDLQLLQTRQARDMAKLSSVARELAWYVMRVVKEMRVIWFGSDNASGARELGPKWIQALEMKQKDQFGQEEANGILDLTSLLVTGRVTESLADFLGSAEQMSERGIQKWESTMSDALVKLRDLAEKRIAPACQRLLIVLHETLGWAQLHQFKLFELSQDEIQACLDMTDRGIVICGWLAAVARKESSHFKEFISFIRHETAAVNPATDTKPLPEHDMLEVNSYLTSGLVVSSIDKWFMGPIPKFSPSDLGEPGDNQDLQVVIQKAKAVFKNPTQIAWQSNIAPTDLSHLDRNLDALIQELATRCQRVFVRASNATARSAVITHSPRLTNMHIGATQGLEYSIGSLMRDHIVEDKNEVGKFLQYLCMDVSSAHRTFLYLSRARYDSDPGGPATFEVVLLNCCASENNLGGKKYDVNWKVCGAEFFDDETMILILQDRAQEDGAKLIATFGYSTLEYQSLALDGDASGSSREGQVHRVLQFWNDGRMLPVDINIASRRELNVGNGDNVTIAVNGRAGRRVACVLDSQGSTMEILDMEGNGEENEGDPTADDSEADEAEG